MLLTELRVHNVEQELKKSLSLVVVSTTATEKPSNHGGHGVRWQGSRPALHAGSWTLDFLIVTTVVTKMRVVGNGTAGL
jgi:hypothetical protein